jgi:hypothetical protein
MPEYGENMSPKKISVLALVMGLLTITTACAGETDCPAIAYACPEGEERCADPEDDGCKEYTFDEEGDCAQTIYCMASEDTAAE